MCMDGMKVKRQMRSALSQSEDVNTSDDATTDCVQCAQCCMVSSSACVALFTLLFTMRSMSVRMCLKSCTMFRSLLSKIFVREFLVQDVLYLHLLLPPLLSSLLPPSHTQKKERELFITGIFPAKELFCITIFKSIQKKQRRVKLQSLQFFFLENIKSAPRQICNYFREMVPCGPSSWRQVHP